MRGVKKKIVDGDYTEREKKLQLTVETVVESPRLKGVGGMNRVVQVR